MFRMFKKTATMCDYTYFSTQITWSVLFGTFFLFAFDNAPEELTMLAYVPDEWSIIVRSMLFIGLIILTSLYGQIGCKGLKSWSDSHIFIVICVMISSFIISLKLAKLLIRIF